MTYIRDQVIVLKKSAYRETDRRYFMYGLEHGLLIAVARGASKITAKQACSLEPLSFADIMIAPGKAHDHLAVATTCNSKLATCNVNPSEATSYKFQVTKKRLGALVVGGAFADLCLSLLKTGIADKRIFELWQQFLLCLSSLPREPTPARAELLFMTAAFRLLDILGYGPALGSCIACRARLLKADAMYAANGNGLICPHCCMGWATHRDPLIKVQADTLALLRFMRTGTFDDLLSVTAPLNILYNTKQVVRGMWSHAPLDREPHGLETIRVLLA